MNYGYAVIEESAETMSPCAELSERYSLQLYSYVVNAVEVRGRDVLEVGCGRGGGASFLKTQFAPRQIVAVDFSLPGLLLAENAGTDGVHFVTGNAESLPIAPEQFDIVINIESSHCYRSIEAFVRQVKRVLRPEGYFLYADFCQADALSDRRELLRRSGMSILREDDITANVVAALERDSERRSSLISKYVNRSLSRSFEEFVGMPHSRIFDELKNRRKVYFRFVLKNG
jgi:ubiquinone/menaquinone biosynthesis C-methylase UbiE